MFISNTNIIKKQKINMPLVSVATSGAPLLQEKNMQELKIFENGKLGKVRVVEKDGEVWFVAKDICDALDLSNSRMVVNTLDISDVSNTDIRSSGQNRTIELGLSSAKELNNLLVERKIQYKVNDTWELYSAFSSLGYVVIKQQVLDNGKVVYNRHFSQAGRDWILEIFFDEGVK